MDLFSLAERKLSEVEFVAFDTEATGYSNFSDRVIEVAGVGFRRQNGAWVGGDSFSELVRPDRAIPAETIASMVANWPLSKTTLGEILDFRQAAIRLSRKQ